MSWKLWWDGDLKTEKHQWGELLGTSPWDFAETPDWLGAEESWDFSNSYAGMPLEEEVTSEPASREAPSLDGRWETNPMTGIKVWISNK
jgi:hypothetical protein